MKVVKNKNKNKKGFTLIELLVVIAIIGLLSSIILASLNSARMKGKDGNIKQNLANMRAAGELSFTNNGNFNLVCTDTLKICTAANCTCHNVFGSWAAYSTLNQLNLVSAGSGTDYWCVDSRGFSTLEDLPLGGAATQCP